MKNQIKATIKHTLYVFLGLAAEAYHATFRS